MIGDRTRRSPPLHRPHLRYREGFRLERREAQRVEECNHDGRQGISGSIPECQAFDGQQPSSVLQVPEDIRRVRFASNLLRVWVQSAQFPCHFFAYSSRLRYTAGLSREDSG